MANPIHFPIQMHGIAFWDEHHKKIVLGNSSMVERRVYHDGKGNPCSEEDGGTLDPKAPQVSIKYYDEARGCFGVVAICYKTLMVHLKGKKHVHSITQED